MKEHMLEHVSAQRDVMFHTATRVVQSKLTAVCNMVQEGLSTGTDQVLVSVRRNYMNVVGDVELSEEARQLRQAVFGIVTESEQAFKAVAERSAVVNGQDGAAAGAAANVSPGETAAMDTAHVKAEENPAVIKAETPSDAYDTVMDFHPIVADMD